MKLFIIFISLFSHFALAENIRVDGVRAEEMYKFLESEELISSDPLSVLEIGSIHCDAKRAENDYAYFCTINGEPVPSEKARDLYFITASFEQGYFDGTYWSHIVSNLKCAVETKADGSSGYQCNFTESSSFDFN